jgi:hypothetical protein
MLESGSLVLCGTRRKLNYGDETSEELDLGFAVQWSRALLDAGHMGAFLQLTSLSDSQA